MSRTRDGFRLIPACGKLAALCVIACFPALVFGLPMSFGDCVFDLTPQPPGGTLSRWGECTLETGMLRLKGSGIVLIPPDSFRGMTSMTSMDLANNLVSTLSSPMSPFANDNLNLRELLLRHNELIKLEAGDFGGISSTLERLDLSHNPLESLHADVLQGMKRLRRLYLSSTRLATLPSGLFRSLVELEELYLENNELLIGLPAELLDPLTALRILKVTDNPLLPCLPMGAARFAQAGTSFLYEGPQRCVLCIADAPAAGCKCGKGSSGQDGGPCLTCEPGKYKSSAGTELCVSCPAASVGNHDRIECVCDDSKAVFALGSCVCIAGYSNAAGGLCVECTAGSYKATTSAGACTTCTDNSQSPSGSTNPSSCECNAGYTSEGSGCRACGRGAYKVSAGSAPCTICAGGTFSPSSAGTSSSICAACPDAQSSSAPGSVAATDCQCNAGYIGPNSGPCEACSAATYKGSRGWSRCSECPEGVAFRRL
jgi:hypothetical protein